MTVMYWVAKRVYSILPSQSSVHGVNNFKEGRKASVLCHYHYHEEHFKDSFI